MKKKRTKRDWLVGGTLLLFFTVGWLTACEPTSPKTSSPTSSTTPLTHQSVTPTRAFSSDAQYETIYAGRERCMVCHQTEHEGWQHSFHSRAMEPATEQTVLGDFRKVRFDREGTTAEMFSANSKFFMKARARDNSLDSYPVTYTFGAKHMQDYLTLLPNGRIQVLPVYYHITGKQWVDFTTIKQGRLNPNHPFYWTNFRRTFNKECFDCHVTAMEINYDSVTDRFNTRWMDISVSCESCHGPGTAHSDAPSASNIINPRKLDAERELAICARCHGPKSPHFSIYSNHQRYFPGDNYQDFFTPLLPVEIGSEGSADFYPDGRPQNSSFEYQALIQSRCFLNARMTCLTCHTAPHNAKGANELPTPTTTNSLCADCHQKIVDNASAHSKHKPEGATALCVSCHMPKLIPGVLDKFADHTIDIPNPDNTRDFKIPNACNECHLDKPVDWAIEQFRKLYPSDALIRRKVLAAAFTFAGRPEAERALISILTNQREAPFLRANAASLLVSYHNSNAIQALTWALSDSNYLIKTRAAAALATMREAATDERTHRALVTLLQDANLMVRVQAANALLVFGDRRGLDLFESLATTPNYQDWFRARAVLANYYYTKGDLTRAADELVRTLADKPDYLEAIRLLAVISEKQGKIPEAVQQWSKILRFDPGNKEAAGNITRLGGAAPTIR
ncbi:MAG: HEAT repeat domain-containing protein [Acidobacteriota bacterium]